jgi:hypothetical protein
MTMIYVTDATTKKKVAVNSQYVTVVFEIVEGENTGKTAVGLINGTIVVDEADYDVVAQLNVGGGCCK